MPKQSASLLLYIKFQQTFNKNLFFSRKAVELPTRMGKTWTLNPKDWCKTSCRAYFSKSLIEIKHNDAERILQHSVTLFSYRLRRQGILKGEVSLYH